MALPPRAGALLSRNNLSDVADAATARSNLGVGPLASITIGAGLSVTDEVLSANMLSVAGRVGAVVLVSADITDAGDSITRDVGTGAGTVAAGDDSRIVGAVQSILVGAANGIASLGADGKLASAQIPDALVAGLTYKGAWNAATNTPPLASGVGDVGDLWGVSVAGTTNLDGNAVWAVGDQATFSGTWARIPLSTTFGTMASQDAEDAHLGMVSVTLLTLGDDVLAGADPRYIYPATSLDGSNRMIGAWLPDGTRFYQKARVVRLDVETVYAGTFIGALAPDSITIAGTTDSGVRFEASDPRSLFPHAVVDEAGFQIRRLSETGVEFVEEMQASRLRTTAAADGPYDVVNKQYLLEQAAPSLYYEPSIDFGAPTDGVTDASSQVNACIAAAVARGDWFIRVDHDYQTPTLDKQVGNVIPIGPGNLIGNRRYKTVIPVYASPIPPAEPTFDLENDCPTSAAVLRAGGTLRFALTGESTGAPGVTAPNFTSTAWALILEALKRDNRGANIIARNFALGGGTWEELDTTIEGAPITNSWYDRDIPWLDYIDEFQPHLVAISMIINHADETSFRRVLSVIGKIRAMSDPSPDIILITSYGASATESPQDYNDARNGMESAVGLLLSTGLTFGPGVGIINSAGRDSYARYGLDPAQLEPIRDPDFLAGSPGNANFGVTLPFTAATEVYSYGAKLRVVGNGFAAMGGEVWFQIGSALNTDNAGCRFYLRRNTTTSEYEFKITTTLVSAGADADRIFKDWTGTGITGAANVQINFELHQRGPLLIFVWRTGGSPDTVANAWTTPFCGYVPRAGGLYAPTWGCAAGSSVNHLYVTTDGFGWTSIVSARLDNPNNKLLMRMPVLIDDVFAQPDEPQPGTGIGGSGGPHASAEAGMRILREAYMTNRFRPGRA